ncbi:venom protease-like [Atheta coriaria]|uniref:venom protease-like n=1 Tax=Dalotia coriaria TaxID=877792 RepID=UPI0031F3F5CD
MLQHRVVIILLLNIGYALSQDDNYCTTPLNDPGVCINIKRCDGLIRLLRSQIQNPEVQNYLRRSTCGYEGTTPLVCCPQLESQFRTTTTTTTRRSVFDPTIPPQILPVFTEFPPDTTPVDTREPTLATKLRPPHCGVSKDSNTRVVGGVPANLKEYPWMVSLGYRNSKTNQPRWLCGGTLITDRHVLTAAHCIHNKDVYVVRVGDLDLYSDDDGATPLNVPIAKKMIHEEYSPTVFVNDIAILTLEHPVTLSYVIPVCLPLDEPQRSLTYENSQAIVSGWGAVYFNGPSAAHLQKVILPVVPNQKCKDAFAKAKTIIDDRIICAGYNDGKKDSCQGDSGGPLMVANLTGNLILRYQIGVVSYGYRCAEPGFPGVYTRVTQFIDWILKNIQ